MELTRFLEQLNKNTYVEYLSQQLVWLKAEEPFMHFRINDGEFICMSKDRSPFTRNNCGHQYFYDLGDSLQVVFKELRDYLHCHKGTHIQVGSYWRESNKFEDMNEAAQWFVKFLQQHNMLEIIPWVGSDDLVKGLESSLPISIFDEIRSKSVPVYLVGNPNIEQGRYCLRAEFIEIPRIDCWLATGKVMEKCAPLAAAGSIFVWCCGMSKPWIWNLWQTYPQSTHIDAGHLFDGVFGEDSRAWLRRKEGPLWQAYSEVFTPYVKGFIP